MRGAKKQSICEIFIIQALGAKERATVMLMGGKVVSMY